MDTAATFTLERVRVIFKECEFGITGGLPLFRVLPETFTAGKDGICRMEFARSVTAVFGLETLSEGLALLLDSRGHMQHMPREIFGNPGELRLLPAEDPLEREWFFPCARLAGNTRYGIMPDAGHRLLVEFQITPPETNSAYMCWR